MSTPQLRNTPQPLRNAVSSATPQPPIYRGAVCCGGSFQITIRPIPGYRTPVEIRLRWVLKKLLRTHGFRVITISPLPAEAPPVVERFRLYDRTRVRPQKENDMIDLVTTREMSRLLDCSPHTLTARVLAGMVEADGTLNRDEKPAGYLFKPSRVEEIREIVAKPLVSRHANLIEYAARVAVAERMIS